jgi:hypothetical protein
MPEDTEDPFHVEDRPEPIPGMTLYGPGTDWHQTACVGWSIGRSYSRIRGFRKGASVIGGWVAANADEQDGLIYPYLSLWRHHIELVLKQAIEDLLVVTERPRERWHGHSLRSLWDRYWALAHDAGLADDAGGHCAAVINELHDVDPAGDAFRYARRRDGTPTLAAWSNVSFEVMEDVLGRVANYLDVVTFGTSAMRKQAEDAAAALSGY